MKRRVFFLLFALLPMMAMAQWVVDDQGDVSKTNNDHVSYEYNRDTKTLRIYGTGEMWDGGDASLWYLHDSQSYATTIIIEEGVTHIGNQAFRGFEAVTSVTIPSTVTSIGSDAFYACRNLQSIDVPSSVNSIGQWAFADCTTLTSFTLKGNLNYCGEYVFQGCSSLKTINIASGVTSIPAKLCKDLNDHGGGLRYLETVNIAGTVESIGDEAFKGCQNLKTVNFEGTVLPTLGSNVFEDDGSDRKIYVPGHYSYRDESTWSNDYKNAIIVHGSCGDNVTFELNIANKVLTISGTGAMTDYVASSDVPWYVSPSKKSPVESVIVNEGVTHIGANAFTYLDQVTSVSLPSTLLSIGSYAFNYCQMLPTITIPNSVTTIRDWAFKSCDGMKTITIGSGVTKIGIDAFSGCTAMTDVYCNADPANLTWDAPTIQNFKLDKQTLCHVPVGTEAAWVANANYNVINLTFTNDFTQNVTGMGTEAEPYVIMNAADWNRMVGEQYFTADLEGKYFRQGANIELDRDVKNNITPIETFDGHYDGAGYYFSGINIECLNETDNAALFINVVNSSSIKNVIIKSGTFKSSTESDAAPLAIYMRGASRIENCHVLKDVTVIGKNASGLVDNMTNYDNSSTITACSSQATVNSVFYTTGLVTSFGTGSLTDCLYLGGDNLHTEDTELTNYFTRAVTKSIDDAKPVNCYYINPNLSDTYASQRPNALHDNSGFLQLLRQRDNFLEHAAGGLDKADYNYDLTIRERILYKDKCWNTIVLPFDFDTTLSSDLNNGSVIRELQSATVENKTLNLTFSTAPVTTIKAGVPYIIRWTYEVGSANHLAHPLFEKPVIDNTDHSYDNGETGDKRVRFVGTYAKLTFTDANKAGVYVMGNSNKLQPVKSGANLAAFSAYFKIGEDDAPAQVNSININFGEDSTTGISSIENGILNIENAADGCYTLDGKRINSQSSNGIYINNGVKIVK